MIDQNTMKYTFCFVLMNIASKGKKINCEYVYRSLCMKLNFIYYVYQLEERKCNEKVRRSPVR